MKGVSFGLILFMFFCKERGNMCLKFDYINLLSLWLNIVFNIISLMVISKYL